MWLMWGFFLCLCVSGNFSQDCKTPGEACNDDKLCCGGCCFQGICTSSYQNCEEVEYPCMQHYCPPGFECYMYKPPAACVGCDSSPNCRPFNDPGPGRF